MVLIREDESLGYELKAVGYSRSAAKYAGIQVGRSMVLSMMISGALAGLAGVTYYLGYVGSIQPKVLISTDLMLSQCPCLVTTIPSVSYFPPC